VLDPLRIGCCAKPARPPRPAVGGTREADSRQPLKHAPAAGTAAVRLNFQPATVVCTRNLNSVVRSTCCSVCPCSDVAGAARAQDHPVADAQQLFQAGLALQRRSKSAQSADEASTYLVQATKNIALPRNSAGFSSAHTCEPLSSSISPPCRTTAARHAYMQERAAVCDGGPVPERGLDGVPAWGRCCPTPRTPRHQ